MPSAPGSGPENGQEHDTDPPVGVLLVDDNPTFLGIVRRFLESQASARIHVLGTAASGEEAIVLVQQRRPQVVVLDLNLPGQSGLDVLAVIRRVHPDANVVVLTMFEGASYRTAALAAGAHGFVTKAALNTELIPAIFSAAADRSNAMNRILVIDDSVTMRRMVIASLVSLPDVQFDQAGSGLEAIERLALAASDLLVLDLNMPDIHGLEVLRFLRTHPMYQRIPVVVLTTKNDTGSRSDALAAGASAYLTKPFQPTALAACVRQLLQMR